MHCLLATLLLPFLITDSRSRDTAIGDIHMGCSSGWSRPAGGDGVRVPRGIGSLKELQILDCVDIRRTSSKPVKELGELPGLRKLAMETNGASKKKCRILCSSLEKLSSLRFLSVRAGEHQDRGLGWLISSSSPPPHLRTLRLSGYIGEMTDWFRNLTQLVKIFLDGSQLKEDKTMGILGELPKLMLLQFYSRAYLGKKLVFGAQKFPKLRKLHISYVDLEKMTFKKGTSPHMETIIMDWCNILKSGIIGVKHLPRLKEISLRYGSTVARLSKLEKELLNTHRNHPVLQVSDHFFQNLGQVEGSNVKVEAAESLPEHDGEIGQVITLTTTDSEIQPASS